MKERHGVVSNQDGVDSRLSRDPAAADRKSAMAYDYDPRSANEPRVVFLLGAGRSGTTFLYKLLCKHPDTAWVSNYVAKVPSLPELAVLNRLARHRSTGAWFQANGNAYFRSRPWTRKWFPTPVEGEDFYTSCGIPAFFDADWAISPSQRVALRQKVKRLTRAQGGALFLTKRTANNRRVAQLHSVFPHARFVHVVRDGRAVAASLVDVPWWPHHAIWWNERKSPTQLVAEGHSAIELAARNWIEELREIENGCESIPRAQIHTVRYETLVKDAPGTLAALYAFLGLAPVDGLGTLPLGSRVTAWRERLDPDEQARVTAIQEGPLVKYGYLDSVTVRPDGSRVSLRPSEGQERTIEK